MNDCNECLLFRSLNPLVQQHVHFFPIQWQIQHIFYIDLCHQFIIILSPHISQTKGTIVSTFHVPFMQNHSAKIISITLTLFSNYSLSYSLISLISFRKTGVYYKLLQIYCNGRLDGPLIFLILFIRVYLFKSFDVNE